MRFHQDEVRLISFLEYEWECAIHRISAEVDCAGLRRPVFSLNPRMSCWGRWRGGNYQILELSADLVWNHPWYSVCEVLRHEMAHQLQEFLFPDARESCHGPCFRRCCRLLLANPSASGLHPLTDQVVFPEGEDGAGRAEQTRRQRIAARIHKLLALSRSSNPHEAENALLKARELMQKHQLESPEEEGEEEEGFYYITLGRPFRRRPYNEHVIANILNNYYSVRAVWQFAPSERGESYERVLAIFGKATDLKIASYVYDGLHVAIDRYWRLHREDFRGIRSSHARSDFAYGLLKGFREALAKQPVPPETQALVLARERALDEYFDWQNPDLGTGRRTAAGRYVNPRIQAAGHRIGRELTLPKGVDGGNGEPAPRFLT